MRAHNFKSDKKNIHNLVVYAISYLMLICGCIWSINIISYAAEETSGEWTYTYTVDGATITKYSGDNSVLEIPSSINSHKVIGIAPETFKNSTVTELTIPKTITSIGYRAFHNCKNLSKIYFNAVNCSSCDGGSDGTFYNAGSESGEIKVVFGAEVKQIPANLFYVNSDTYYARITSVSMSDSIQKIGDYAFYNCFNLKSVTWGNSIETIGHDAFRNCIKMENIKIPETTTSIGYRAFHNCKSLTSVSFNAINCSSCDGSSDGTFYNAGSESGGIKVVFGAEVKQIPANLFYVNSDTYYARITSVSMSDSIQKIGDYAFYNCFNLKSVTWGNSIETIGHDAFRNCIKMENIKIPETTTSIGYRAFHNCKSLTSVSFNAINCSSCDGSSDGTFYNAGAESDSLKVEFGSKVKVIPSNLFYVNQNYNYGDGEYAHVTSVKMSNSILDIGSDAFNNCFDLKSVTWGSSIKTIAHTAFRNCIKMVSVKVPESTTSIGYRAFYDCRSLSSISFNAINCSSCDGSSDGTFYNAGAESDSLKVEFGSKVKVIPSNLFYVDQSYNYGDGKYAHITSVKISDSILNIGGSAFYACYDLANITWGSSIEIIDNYAFGDCISLASVTLPKTVTKINYAAFRDCSNLKKVVIKSKNAKFDSYVFENCHKDLKIYCYRGSTALEYAKKNDIKYSYLDLAPVSISSVANTGSGVKIAWKKVSGATGYYVYRKTKDTSYKKIKTIEGGDKLNYTDTSVKDKNGSTYYYTVKAYSSSKSSSTYTTKKIVRLKGISISKLQNKSGKKMYVSWGKNSKASGYQIQYSTSSKFSNAKSVTVSGYKNVSKTISKLTKGKKYYVRVRAYKKSGDVKYYSAWSSSKSIKISK
ncbi:MAG: leucine-rich repeat protein [Bacillus sp. (in: firmicutes)]